MRRAIVAFSRDDANDWVARLSCHHDQHVRHKPPFTNRPWVESEEGRKSRLGSELDCVLCERLEMPAFLQPYRRTPQFTECTIPRGLLNDHATKEGVWGRIHVVSGRLQYTVANDISETAIIDANEHRDIAPQMLHSVKPLGSVRFFVEFFRAELTRDGA